MLCMAMSIAETLAVDRFRRILWYMLLDHALPCRSRLTVAVAAAAPLLLRVCKRSSPCAPQSNSTAAIMKYMRGSRILQQRPAAWALETWHHGQGSRGQLKLPERAARIISRDRLKQLGHGHICRYLNTETELCKTQATLDPCQRSLKRSQHLDASTIRNFEPSERLRGQHSLCKRGSECFGANSSAGTLRGSCMHCPGVKSMRVRDGELLRRAF
jgi:hypothetical protein